MTGEQLAQIVADPRLTPEAVRVILHVALLPEGVEHAVKGETLSILVQGGEKPVRAAITRAEHCGYLTARFGGRAGHYLTFRNPSAGGGNSESEGNPSPGGGNSDALAKEIPPQGEAISENDAPQGGNSDAAGGTLGGGDQTSSDPSVAVVGVDVAAVARDAIRAMNRGMAVNPAARATGYQPVLQSHGASVQQVADWLQEGIPPPVLVELAEECARTSREGRVHSLSYFGNPVRQAYEKRRATEEALRHERNGTHPAAGEPVRDRAVRGRDRGAAGPADAAPRRRAGTPQPRRVVLASEG